MAGGHGAEAVIFGPGAEYAELDLAITHHIWVGREAVLITVEQVGDNAFAVVLHEVDDAKFNSESVAHGAGVLDVLLPRAVADDVVLVDPVLHVGADEVVPLLFEQERGDGAVNSAGHGDEDIFRFWQDV